MTKQEFYLSQKFDSFSELAESIGIRKDMAWRYYTGVAILPIDVFYQIDGGVNAGAYLDIKRDWEKNMPGKHLFSKGEFECYYYASTRTAKVTKNGNERWTGYAYSTQQAIDYTTAYLQSIGEMSY